MKHIITTQEITIRTYEVEAKTMKDALIKLQPSLSTRDVPRRISPQSWDSGVEKIVSIKPIKE